KTWTVRLKDGVTFHNGKPVTAADVIYTLRRIGNPKKPLAGASSIAPLRSEDVDRAAQRRRHLPQRKAGDGRRRHLHAPSHRESEEASRRRELDRSAQIGRRGPCGSKTASPSTTESR